MGGFSRLAVFGVAGALWGCGGTDATPAFSPTDAGPVGDGGSVGVSLNVAATSGSLNVPFDFSVAASGAGIRVNLLHGVGTVQTGTGPALAAFAYERVVWGPSEPDLVLYQLLAVDAEDWQVLFVYCQGLEVIGVYSEATNAPTLSFLDASGNCAADAGAVTTETLTLPSSELVLDGLEQQFSVTGLDLQLSPDDVGSMQLAGVGWSVYPFSVVDCSTGCGSPGWYELHSIFWRPGNTCFGIYYLFPDMPGSELLAYALCLPGLNDPTGGDVSFNSTWTQL